MVLGIGIDIIEISRIQKSLERLGDKFIESVLHVDELKFFSSIKSKKRKLEFLAGRFTAKEAYMKAVGEGMKVGFTNICILNQELGKPEVFVPELPNNHRAHVTISHSENYAVSQVLIEENN